MPKDEADPIKSELNLDPVVAFIVSWLTGKYFAFSNKLSESLCWIPTKIPMPLYESKSTLVYFPSLLVK
jgi:hypothetical protein